MDIWETYWTNLLRENKLEAKVADLNDVDYHLGRSCTIETICQEIFSKYNTELHPRLKAVQRDLLNLLQDIQGVHLLTSRVKSLDSLLCKVIEKRFQHIKSTTNPYSQLTGQNYESIVSDLLGLRFIVNYRGNWKVVHNAILKEFPLLEKQMYLTDTLLPHKDSPYQVEWPKAYHASGDAIDEFERAGLETKLHPKKYRSIHYTLSYQNTYVELQVRTIYDEAWSDVDHRYVYKHEANPSNAALTELSDILATLTNVSNDIGEEMRHVFSGDTIVAASSENQWIVSTDVKDFFKKTQNTLEKAIKQLDRFQKAMVTHDSCVDGEKDIDI